MQIEDRIELVERLALEIHDLSTQRSSAIQRASEVYDRESLKIVRFFVEQNDHYPSDLLIGLFFE